MFEETEAERNWQDYAEQEAENRAVLQEIWENEL